MSAPPFWPGTPGPAARSRAARRALVLRQLAEGRRRRRQHRGGAR